MWVTRVTASQNEKWEACYLGNYKALSHHAGNLNVTKREPGWQSIFIHGPFDLDVTPPRHRRNRFPTAIYQNSKTAQRQNLYKAIHEHYTWYSTHLLMSFYRTRREGYSVVAPGALPTTAALKPKTTGRGTAADGYQGVDFLCTTVKNKEYSITLRHWNTANYPITYQITAKIQASPSTNSVRAS